MNNKFALGVLVSNRSGVLQRVSSLFGRRGFNIDSLTVGETENPLFSRMTISATGDEYIKEQLVKQLQKLIDVRNVTIMQNDNTVCRELLLIKVCPEVGRRSEIIEAATIYRANIVDLATDSLTIELTGETTKINAFIELMRPYGICELCRTGISAITRGNEVIAAQN